MIIYFSVEFCSLAYRRWPMILRLNGLVPQPRGACLGTGGPDAVKYRFEFGKRNRANHLKVGLTQGKLP
jgi:hypothetical protein